MRQQGAIIHIVGQNVDKRDQLVNTLSKTLQDRDYSSIKLLDQNTKDFLSLTDDNLLARVIGWGGELLIKAGALVLVSASAPLSKNLAGLPGYTPAIEIAIKEEFVTSAPQQLSITAETGDLPQEIARIILTLETVLASQDISSEKPYLDENVYSAEEEALMQEHLRSLGYL